MAQALLIKTVNTYLETAGDIVSIFKDTHKFDPHELREKGFDVAKIEGSCEEVVAKLDAIRIPLSIAYKAETIEWTQTRPESKMVWFDVDEKWYFFDNPPKHMWSMALLTPTEKAVLKNNATGLARDAAFKKMIVNPGVWNIANKTEAADLNR